MPINPFVFRRMGLDTVPVTEGGMLPPFVTSEPRINIDSNIFSGSGFGFDNFGQGALGGGSSGGIGGVGGGVVSPPTVVTIGDGTPTQDKILFTGDKSGDPLIDKLTAEEIARLNAIQEKAGLPPLTEKKANEVFVDQTGKVTSIASQIADQVVKDLPRIYEAEDAAARSAATAAARTGAATGNSGIPLIIPIPGIDPVTGLAITAAGLIFSGGNVARLNPKDPIGSVVQAGQGTINTIGNAANVITGQKDISDIWGAGSTGGAGTGTSAGSTAGTGSITGGQNEVIGIDPAGMGVIGVLGTGGGSGTSQPAAGSGNVSVTPGALGGATSGQSQTGGVVPAIPAVIPSQSQTSTIPAGGIIVPPSSTVSNQTAGTSVMGPIFSTTDIAARQAEQERQNKAAAEEARKQQEIYTAAINQRQAEAAAAAAASNTTQVNGPNKTSSTSTGTGVVGTGTGGGTGTGTGTNINQSTGTGTQTGIVGTGSGEQTGTTSTTTITTTGTGTGGAGTSTAVSTTPIVTPTFTFTSPTNTGLAQRDYAKEFGLTAQTLTGQPGSDLASYYQKLQQQFTPSSLTTLGREAESQLAADLARYNEAQRGNLSAEDVRTAQQGAREAYAARGQVMGRGAIGAEILNRDALQRQREAEARASVQQSMGNLANAANLQTGNIFSPFASLISQTYSPTNQYAREVYDYNVNAYNAYQAAEKNLAAYKEAAAKGQEAQFINSFVGFLANNGIQTTTNAVTSILNGLLGGSTKKPGT